MKMPTLQHNKSIGMLGPRRIRRSDWMSWTPQRLVQLDPELDLKIKTPQHITPTIMARLPDIVVVPVKMNAGFSARCSECWAATHKACIETTITVLKIQSSISRRFRFAVICGQNQDIHQKHKYCSQEWRNLTLVKRNWPMGDCIGPTKPWSFWHLLGTRCSQWPWADLEPWWQLILDQQISRATGEAGQRISFQTCTSDLVCVSQLV